MPGGPLLIWNAATLARLTAAEPGVRALRPAVLGPDACRQLVRAGLGGAPSAAFQAACRELTGGNPLLPRALLDSLAAEGVRGSDADVPHLRRLTPRDDHAPRAV